MRSSYARAETSLRNARNLLDQAEAAARNVERSLADREAATSAAVAAIRGVAESLRDGVAGRAGPPPLPELRDARSRSASPCAAWAATSSPPACAAPHARCGKPIHVQVPQEGRARVPRGGDRLLAGFPPQRRRDA